MKKLLFYLIFTTISFFGYSQTPYWSYDFSGGSLQDGVGNDDLTQTGSALTTVADRFSSNGDAVNLNSDVLQGGTVFPTAPGQMGYSFWIKDAVDDANIRIIIDQFDGYGNSIRLQNGKIVVIGRPGYFINPNWNPAFSQTQTLTSTTDVDDGNWHHVVVNAARRSQQEITDYELYIDGTLEASSFANVSLITNQGTAFRPYPTGAPFRVAPDDVNGALQYENIIDDIRYFDQKLSQAQVTALFNAQPPAVYYVDKDATGANDGSSWADAYTSLQSAMNAASGTGDQVWVAEGTYKPDASNRAVFFTLKPGVSLYGGFNGTETSLAQRDWNTYETILSGDLNDNDDNSNVAGLYSEPTRSDNSHRILFLDGNGSTIDGVTIEGGQANLSSNPAFDRGSSIFVDDDVSSIVVRNSTFRFNASRIGNFYIDYGPQNPANSALIESCDFEGNFSRYGAGLSLVVNATGASADVEVYNSRFYNNHAGPISGQTGFAGSSMALFANQGTVNANLVNNTFAYNVDNTTASGVDAATVVMRRLNNTSTDITNLEMYNNIFFNNEDGNGNVNPSGIGGWNFNVFSSITADNNLHDQGELANRTSNFIGSANLTAAPNFVDGPNGDLRLTASSWVIDQGDNSKLPASIIKDVDGEDRILNSTIDLGAHEYNPNLCNPPVAINTQPTDESVCAGDNVTLDVAAAGNNVTYQWQLDGVDISGATSSSLTINGVGQNDLGDYTVIVSDACNDVTSSVASLSLTEQTDITVNFLGVNACEGDDVPFDITGFVDGDNLTYQWFYNGNAINGETGTSYDILDIELTDAGTYSVEATGTCGTDQISTNVTVTESTAITSQPSDETLCAGDNASFSVSANGSNLSYQWKLDGVNLSGETSATLDINGVSVGDAGNYTVEVSGDCGTETSNVAALTVNQSTAITSQPSNETLCAGGDASFSVTASGSNLSYQWKLDGANLAGETSATLNINGVAAGDAGNYTVEVSGDCGTVTSNVATLTVNPSTSITNQPSNETICEGGNVTLSVSATGSNLTYQWKKDGTNIAGATSTSLSISNAQISDAGDYTIEVSGNCGTETSNIAALTVNPGVNISQQPTDETACVGDNVTLSITASGAALSYQWKKDGTNISGATSASLTLTSVDNTDAAIYTVDITSSCGTITSNSADLIVNELTSISTQPSNEIACEGSNITLSVVATGSNLSYQWTKDGSNINGATSASLALNNAQLSDAGDYEVVVTGDCGTETSNTATVTVNQGISVSQQPAAQSACDGDDVTFTVAATGSGLSYQWIKDGNNISGATSTSLILNGVSSADAGDYAVEITASCGTLSSNTANLSVDALTAISTQPNDETTCEGGNITLSVVVIGANLTYQWTKDGSNISGATSASLVLNNVQLSDAGNYEVVVTGDCGTVTSSTATVTVNQGISITQQPISSSTCPGDNVQFDILATGTGLTYQWFKDNNSINGATSASLSLNNVQVSDAGDYSVEITASCGTVNSNVATLTIGTTTAITQQPSGITVCEGVDTSLTVVANGSNLTYQWNFNGNPIAGETSNVLSLSDVQTSDDGSYTVDVIGDCGTVSSISVAIAVNTNASFSAQPGIFDLLCLGDTVTLSSSTTGNTSGSQWLFNGNPIIGETFSNLTIENITPADIGSYVREVIGNCGVFYSDTVNLEITPTTSIITQPNDVSVCAGNQAAFTVDAEGGNLSYEWFFNGNSIGSVIGNTNVVTASAESSDEGFYFAIVTGECGVAQSDSAELTVTTLSPQIIETNGILSTGAFDTYQWFFNGNVISSATSQNFTPSQNGVYTVEVSDINACSAISNGFNFVGTSIRMYEIIDLTVYPNPATDKVKIQTDEDLLIIELNSISGKLVKQFNPKQKILDVSNLADGVYFLNLKTNNNRSVIKLILQR